MIDTCACANVYVEIYWIHFYDIHIFNDTHREKEREGMTNKTKFASPIATHSDVTAIT